MDLMRARKQAKDEILMEYFQPKMRMCRELSLSFEVSKDYLLQGLYSRELALYVVGRRHLDEDDLLDDPLRWDRMNMLHRTTVGFERKTDDPRPRTDTKQITQVPRPVERPVRPTAKVTNTSPEPHSIVLEL